jgi:hypothetical protein
MIQVSELNHDINQIRTNFCLKTIKDLQSKNCELTKKMSESKLNPNKNSNELSHLQTENIQLRHEIQSLKAQLSTLENQKSRLKIEEIDEIQQKTIEEMHTLNEQSMVQK